MERGEKSREIEGISARAARTLLRIFRHVCAIAGTATTSPSPFQIAIASLALLRPRIHVCQKVRLGFSAKRYSGKPKVLANLYCLTIFLQAWYHSASVRNWILYFFQTGFTDTARTCFRPHLHDPSRLSATTQTSKQTKIPQNPMAVLD